MLIIFDGELCIGSESPLRHTDLTIELEVVYDF